MKRKRVTRACRDDPNWIEMFREERAYQIAIGDDTSPVRSMKPRKPRKPSKGAKRN